MLGIDYLGGAKYGQVVLDSHPSGYCAGFFANSFGDALPVIEKLADSGKCPVIRVHGVWSDTHTFGQNELNLAVHEAKRLRPLAATYPKVEFLYSPFCEHDLVSKNMLAVMHECEKVIGSNIKLVNTPYKGAILNTYLNEVHGPHSAPKASYQYSFDGTDTLSSDFSKFKNLHSEAQIMFLWTYKLNLKSSLKDPTPISQRKVRPTKNTIIALVRAANDAT